MLIITFQNIVCHKERYQLLFYTAMILDIYVMNQKHSYNKYLVTYASNDKIKFNLNLTFNTILFAIS